MPNKLNEQLNARTWDWLFKTTNKLTQKWMEFGWPIRIIIATLFIAFSGIISHTMQLGPYKLCVCNFACGSSLVIALIGGPRYAISVFFGMLFFNYTEHFSALGNNYFMVSLVEAITAFLAGWLVQKLHLRFSASTTMRQMLVYVTISLILPIIIMGLIFAVSINLGVITPSNSLTEPLLSKLTFQSYIAGILGELICFTMFGFISDLSRASLSRFIRMGIFTVICLAGLFINFQIASQADITAIENNIGLEADHLTQVIGQILDGQVHSINDLRNQLTTWNGRLCSPEDIQHSLHEKLQQDSLSDMAFYLSAERSTSYDLWQGLRRFKQYNFVMTAASQARQEYNDILSKFQVLQSSDDERIHRIAEVIITMGNTDSLPLNMSCAYFTLGDVLLMAKPHYLDGELRGVIVLGLDTKKVINKYFHAIGVMEAANLGARVSLTHPLDRPGAQERTLYMENSSESFIFDIEKRLHYGNTKAPLELKLHITGIPNSGDFLLPSLERFTWNCLLFTFVAMLGHLFMGQYDAIDAKAREQLKSLDEKERFNTKIIENVDDMFVATDLMGTITAVNQATCDKMGQTRQQLLGQFIHKVFHRDMDCVSQRNCEFAHYYLDLRAHGIHSPEDEEKFRRLVKGVAFDKDGKLFEAECQLCVIGREDGTMNILMVVHDIHLERQLQKMRSEYVMTLSHEMRSPLVCIKGSLDLFDRFTDKIVGNGELTTRGRELLDSAKRNADKLSQLVNDILLSDSIENDNLELKLDEKPVSPIIARVIERYQGKAEAKQIRLHTGTVEGEVPLDELRLEQILVHLVGNAIKYSPPGKEVIIESRYDEQRRYLQFSVKDQGEGIPPEQLQSIFSRFIIGDATSARKHGGLGLGLSICHGLVSAHGGKIWVESQVGRGSTFYFTIPTS